MLKNYIVLVLRPKGKYLFFMTKILENICVIHNAILLLFIILIISSEFCTQPFILKKMHQSLKRIRVRSGIMVR